MARFATPLVGLFAAALLAAPAAKKPRAPRAVDGGAPLLLGPDRPGQLRIFDAGFSDAGAPDARVDGLSRDVQQLRARLDVLEQQQRELRDQAGQAAELRREIEAIRAQLAAADADRERATQVQEDRRSQVASGIQLLAGAEQRLAGGNSDVDDALAQAEAAFSGPARYRVQAARQALRNRDLSAARAHIAAAAAEARTER